MYAIAPIAFLVFGINSVRGLGLETLTYALPSILIALNANFIIHKGVRFSFWNEIFEYAMAFQDGLVTFMALINPKMGSFNVTDKGLQVSKRSFDWNSVQILLIVISMSLLSLFLVPYWLITELQDSDAVFINAAWCLVNVLLLSAAILVALEQPQLRRSHRLDRHLAATLFSGESTLQGTTVDISETGARIQLSDWPNLPDVVDLELHGDTSSRVFLTARVLRVAPRSDSDIIITVAFEDLTPAQQDALILVLYSDVEQWYSQFRPNSDRPLESIRFLITSLLRVFYHPEPSASQPVLKQITAPAQVYSHGHYLDAVAYAINSQGMRAVLQHDHPLILHPEIFGAGEPVGLSVEVSGGLPVRLVAQLTKINRSDQQTTLELGFPKVLEAQQSERIRSLMYDLTCSS
jgi:cellulose synthase (UDP-forming)